jgi:predicted nucleotidyltransferase
MTSKEIIKNIKSSVSKKDPTAEVILFGSRAKGNFSNSSDYDIIILINKPKITNEIEDTFRESLYDIELKTGQIISLQIYPKEYWNKKMIYTPLFNEIQTDGIRL